MIHSLQDQADELIRLLTAIKEDLTTTDTLPDLEAAKALVELSRIADRTSSPIRVAS